MSQPTPVWGQATRITAAQVTTVHPDGTVAVRSVQGRSAKDAVPVAIAGYTPLAGDRLLLCDLGGDAQAPVAIALLSAAPRPAEGGWDTGDLKLTTRSTAPSGWLLFAGQTLNRVDYPRLWKVAEAEIAAGNALYTAGNGSTTFALADLRGRVPLMAGQGAGLSARTLGQTLGAQTYDLASGTVVVDVAPSLGVNCLVRT